VSDDFDLKETVSELPAGRAWPTPKSPLPRYRILGLAGTGGMGVVYRAEDTLLGRTVALKFLPPMLTPNPRAKQRFLNEARAASALDHPNICTIYEVGETVEGQLYLAMACYDGETLKRRLEGGPLAVAEAVHIALQVAHGLAKAHQRGIIHRDIKPANLMITADGIVKILDFGIAKLPEQTLAGPLLGTPAYMSPEQARGEEVDSRSDVWSLGAVLYEMLTGRPPGHGGHEDDTDEAAPAMLRRPGALPELGGVLSRMLAREPADRYPDASALLTDLSSLESTAAGKGRARAPGRTRRRLALAVLIAVLVVSSFSWFLRGVGRPSEAKPASLRATLTRLTDLPGRAWYPSLSPDGNLFLYVGQVGGRSRLFLQRVGGGKPFDLLPDSFQEDTQPAFSPDGQQIAFRSERDGGGLFVMGATGESVHRVTDFGFNPTWSPNGEEIAYATEGIVDPRIRRQRSEIFRVNLATGEGHLVSRDNAVQPSWSPHGFRIAYWRISLSGQRAIRTVPAGGGAAVQVTNGPGIDWNPAWSPDGRFLYFVSDRSGVMNLWRVPIDERSGRVLGDPEPVTTSSQTIMLPSISRDGRRIAYAAGEDSKTILEKVDFDPVSGTARKPATAIHETSRMISTLDASRDGRWLLFQSIVPQEDLFMVHPDGTGLRQLTNDGFKNRHPRLSPDGTCIAFQSTRGGKYDLWTIRADGSKPERATAIHGRPAYHPIWSPDGKQLACDIEENEALIDLTRPLADRQPLLFPPAEHGLSFAASSWSADDRWLAGILHSPYGARVPGIVLYSLTDRRYVRVTDRGEDPSWLSDSRRLLYWDGGKLFLLDTQSRRSRQVLATPPGFKYEDLSLSPDDRVLYLVRRTDEGSIWLLTLR
jgi:Tol biopolymer transport system component